MTAFNILNEFVTEDKRSRATVGNSTNIWHFSASLAINYQSLFTEKQQHTTTLHNHSQQQDYHLQFCLTINFLILLQGGWVPHQSFKELRTFGELWCKISTISMPFLSPNNSVKTLTKNKINKLCGRPPQYAPAPCKLTFDLLTLKVVSKSRVTCATSVPILVFLGLSVLDLGPMYATDRQTSDAHHRLMPLHNYR